LSKRLLKSTLVISSMTMISRVFGLIRDIVIAIIFGANFNTDAFFVAFKIPNYLRRLFAEGAFSQAFVPVLSEYKSQRSQEDVQELINNVCGTLGMVLFIISVIGVIAAPILIIIFSPGFFIKYPDQYDLTVGMLRITFPYILFISLTAFAGGILNTYGRFAIPAFTPVFLNISLILTAIWLSPIMAEPITALAWGVFIAGVVQLLFQMPFLLKLKFFPKPKFNPKHEGVKRILQLMLPALFAVSVVQINLVVDMLMASFLQAGSISWLYYSDRLMEFPLGVFGVALATVILPNLSSQHATGASEKFSHMLDWALRWSLLVGIPAGLGLILLAGPLLTTIFQYGEFTPRFVQMASYSLISYAIGLLGFILIKVLASGYFSRQDTKTPVKIGVVAMVTNIILNLILIGPLAHAGLALATSLAAFVNAGLLFFFLRKKKVYEFEKGWGRFLFQIIMASVAMGLLLYFYVPNVQQWLSWGVYERVLQLSVCILLGVVSYFSVLWICGLRLRHMTLTTEQV